MEAAPRRLGLPLGIAIFLLPLVFAWFTLRPGYSAGTQWAVFVYLFVNLCFVAVRGLSAF